MNNVQEECVEDFHLNACNCPACGSGFRNQSAKILSLQGTVIDCGHPWHNVEE